MATRIITAATNGLGLVEKAEEIAPVKATGSKHRRL